MMLITLVEDDEVLRRDMAEILTQRNYQVKALKNYEEAEKAINFFAGRVQTGMR